jgi:hypothetical protein
VRIDGYASEEGGQTHNWELSCDRAQSVATVLTAPRIGRGIPTTKISVFAHGASTDLGPTHEANRVATVTLPVRAAPAPAPATPPAPPPAFVCGPDVSQEVRDAVAKTRSTFAGWSVADRTSACDALDSLSTGGFAWDIIELHNNAWILGYRPACATAGATPPCGSTVEIDGECSYAGSPNYVIFGVMCSLCNGHFTLVGPSTRAADFSQAAMLRLIDLYKGTGFTGLGTPAGNFGPSNDWARAGYRGWPAASSPTGDRPGCSPACAAPYSGAPFMVHWWPHGVF